MDAFSAVTPPFQLTTRETAARLSGSLNPDGLLVVNVIGSLEGPAAAFARASFATYSSEFRGVEWYRASPHLGLAIRQNITLIASQDKALVADIDSKVTWTPLAAPIWTARDVLTDDFAPVEMLTARQ